MRRSLVLGVLACGLAAPAMAQGTDRAPGMQQTLQGLLSGNRDQDRALQDAYERGYQRGREDEARLAQRGRDPRGSDTRGSDTRGSDDRGYSSGRPGSSDNRGSGSGSYSR